MAELSISTGEIFKIGRDFDVVPELIRDIYDDNGEIVAKINVSKYLPDLKLRVSYEEFREGRVIFKIVSPTVIKLPLKLLKKELYRDMVFLEKGRLILDIDKAILTVTDKIHVAKVEYINRIFKIKI